MITTSAQVLVFQEDQRWLGQQELIFVAKALSTSYSGCYCIISSYPVVQDTSKLPE